jgi:DNA-binding transcriptional MerR regulator
MELLTIASAAQAVGISVETVRNYERESLLAPMRDSAGRRLYTKTDVETIRKIHSSKSTRRENTST